MERIEAWIRARRNADGSVTLTAAEADKLAEMLRAARHGSNA